MSLFVYIDAENLNNSIRECGYAGVDYSKLFNWFKTKKGVDRVYLYAAQQIGDTKQEAMFRSLERLGYVLRLKEVKEYPPSIKTYILHCPKCNEKVTKTVTIKGRRKANCDSELTLDVINDGVRKKYSEIIVFSGDGDFARMYTYVCDQLHKKVRVYSPLSGQAKLRTSTQIKTLHNNGTIKLEALEGILSHFAVPISSNKSRKKSSSSTALSTKDSLSSKNSIAAPGALPAANQPVHSSKKHHKHVHSTRNSPEK